MTIHTSATSRAAVRTVFAASAGLVAISPAHPQDDSGWGVGLAARHARIAIEAPDRYASDAVPLLYYDGERLFLDGTEGGIRLGGGDGWQVNAFGRIRFFDMPADTDDDVKSDARDIGLQVRRELPGAFSARTELLSAGNRRYYLDTGVEAKFGDDYASVRPYLGLRFKSARFNNHYLGLGEQDMGAGVDLRGTLSGRLHVAGNLYLIGSAGFTWLDEDARDTDFIRDDVTWEALAGLGLFGEPGAAPAARGADEYLRASWGWATPANLGDIIRLESEEDPYDNSLSSLFYGRLLADELFGRPMDVYMTVGAAVHHRSRVQQRGAEYVAAIKAYRTFHWPVRVRLGLAEGLSYVTRVTHVEGSELERKGYRPSKLLNYLDLSVDIHVGDLVRSLDGWWLGYGIHHRSGVFESGSQFGRVHGGSNYNTIYLQRHF